MCDTVWHAAQVNRPVPADRDAVLLELNLERLWDQRPAHEKVGGK